MSDSVTPWTVTGQAPLSSTVSKSLLKVMFIEFLMLYNPLILCRHFLHLPSIFPTIRVFSNESGLHIKWPKYWRFSISPSNEYSGLVSFRIDLSIYLQSKGPQESSPESKLESISYSVLSLLYGPTLLSIHDDWKKHSLTIWTFVGEAISLLFRCCLGLSLLSFQGASVF